MEHAVSKPSKIIQSFVRKVVFFAENMLKAMFKIFHESPSREEDFEILRNTEFKKPLCLSSLPCTEKENVGHCKASETK